MRPTQHRRVAVTFTASLPHRDAAVVLVEAGPGLDRLARPDIGDLTVVRWKAQNLARLRERDPAKGAAQARAMRAVLEGLDEPDAA